MWINLSWDGIEVSVPSIMDFVIKYIFFLIACLTYFGILFLQLSAKGI